MVFYDLKKGSEIDEINLPLSLALGCFDGLHLGHAQLIAEAKSRGYASGVFTFAQNPFNVPRIISAREKLSVLSGMGVDYCVVCDFSEVSEMSWQAFVDDILISKLNTRHAVCGFNFKFGKNAEGTAELLRARLLDAGRSCRIIEAYEDNAEAVSSSRIRLMLSEGNVEGAARLLGRSYSLEYNVSHGNGIGTTLGFPTINTPASPELLPLARGVYICRCMGMPAVTNFGVRPTVTCENVPVYETYILDYKGDLYGKSIKVEFLKRLRDEMKFDSREELISQIYRDVDATRRFFE